MRPNIELIDFGVSDYEKILHYQTDLFEQMIRDKKETGITEKEYLLLGEHEAVITIGKHGKKENILFDSFQLESNKIKVFEIGRGGDVTYHCPGQLIAYPLIDLNRHGLGVKKYVDLLEETVIEVIADYGLEGERIEGATGVWIRKNGEDRKICALGIKCSRYCTMHGIALNVNSKLDGFKMINPCGFTDKGVTSIQQELKKEIDMKEVKKRFSDIFFRLVFSL
ncbi:MAG: lipoyl(octanoyl) transferase LipB [Muribaculaceae bacterium]|nr:lipoyl(octanoyl) transferase LipB [Muribaculaceae bacterium]